MEIKIGTFNIQNGIDRKYYLETNTVRRDCTMAAEAIRDMGIDICGLNEISNEEGRGGIDDPKFIAEKLGYYYAFGKARIRPDGVTEYGNALVSRYPIIFAECVPIRIPLENRVEGRKMYEDRVVLRAEISVNGRILTVLCTHFGLYNDEIDLCVRTLRECAEKSTSPVLAMGDFNLTPDSGFYTQICEFLSDTAVMMNNEEDTFPSEAPIKRIDYIFVDKEMKILHASVPPVVVSDHRPYVIIADL